MPYRTIREDEILLHFPESARPDIKLLFEKHSFSFRITAPRQTRLGSFRPSQNKVPVVSVNIDLKQYTFLLIFLHEVAHLIVWEQYGRDVKAHGQEWKKAFRELAEPFFENNVFPADLENELRRYFRSTPATFSRNTKLINALAFHEGGIPSLTVADIPFNETFSLAKGKTFVKLQKRRTRFKCYCPADRRYYLVHGSAKVLQAR